MAELIKIDRNGSKHYHGMIPCDRCGGLGGADAWKFTGWTCYKCGGTGKIEATWIERTPEYEAKLQARRKAKAEAKMAKLEAEEAQREAERKLKEAQEEEARKAEEEREKAEKAISQFVGEAGEKITFAGFFDHTAWYSVYDMFGRPSTRYIHTFKDEHGNKIVWKTSKGLLDGNDNLYQDGDPIIVTGTIKEHNEYKDEKQTILLRVKVKRREV